MLHTCTICCRPPCLTRRTHLTRRRTAAYPFLAPLCPWQVGATKAAAAAEGAKVWDKGAYFLGKVGVVVGCSWAVSGLQPDAALPCISCRTLAPLAGLYLGQGQHQISSPCEPGWHCGREGLGDSMGLSCLFLQQARDFGPCCLSQTLDCWKLNPVGAVGHGLVILSCWGG